MDVFSQCLSQFFSVLSAVRSRLHFDLESIESFGLLRSLLLKLPTLKPSVFSKVEIEFFFDSLSEGLTDAGHLPCSPVFRTNSHFQNEERFEVGIAASNGIAVNEVGDNYMGVTPSNEYEATTSSALQFVEKWPMAELSTACFDWIDRSALKSGTTEESTDLWHDSLNAQLQGGHLRSSLTGGSHVTEEEVNQLHLTIADLEKQLAEKDSELADALCELRAQRAELVTSMNLYLEKLDELNEIRAENGKLKDTATETERTHRFQRAELIKEADSLRDSLQSSENEFFLLKKELADTQRELHLVQASATLREQETDAVSCESEKLVSELVKLRSEERNLRKIITFEQSERDQLRQEYESLMMRYTKTVDNFTQMEKRLVAVNKEIHAMISQLSRSRQSVFSSDQHWKTVRSRLLFLQNVISSSTVQSPEEDKPSELNEFFTVISSAACQHDESLLDAELTGGSSLRKELDNSLIQLGPLSVNTADFYGNHCFPLVTSASSFSSGHIHSITNEFQVKSSISSQEDTTGFGILSVEHYDKYKMNFDQAHASINHKEDDFIKTRTRQKSTTMMENDALILCEETTESRRDIATSNTELTDECLTPFLQEICPLLKLPLSQATERFPHCDKKMWYDIITCVKRLHDRYLLAQAERSRLTALLTTIRNELKQQEVGTQEDSEQIGSISTQMNNIKRIPKYEYWEIADKCGQPTELGGRNADMAEKMTRKIGNGRETEAKSLPLKTVEFQQQTMEKNHNASVKTEDQKAPLTYQTTIASREDENEKHNTAITQKKTSPAKAEPRRRQPEKANEVYATEKNEKHCSQERLEELERQLFSVRSDLESVLMEKEALHARVSMATEECADWQSRLSEAERCVSDRIECAVSAAVSELQARLESLTAERDVLASGLDHVRLCADLEASRELCGRQSDELVCAHERLEELERQLFSVRSDLEGMSVDKGTLGACRALSTPPDGFPVSIDVFSCAAASSPLLSSPVLVDSCSNFVFSVEFPSGGLFPGELTTAVSAVEKLNSEWTSAAHTISSLLRDFFVVNSPPSFPDCVVPGVFAVDVCSCLRDISGRLEQAASVDNECNTLRAQLLDSKNNFEIMSNELLSVQRALNSQTVELQSFRSDVNLLADLILKLSISATPISDVPDSVSVSASALRNVLHHAKESMLTSPICQLNNSLSADALVTPLSPLKVSIELASNIQPTQPWSSMEFLPDSEEVDSHGRSAVDDIGLVDKSAVTLVASQDIPTTRLKTKMPSGYLQLQREVVKLRSELLVLKKETADAMNSLKSDLGMLVCYENYCRSTMVKRQVAYFPLLHLLRNMVCHVREIFIKFNIGKFLSEYDIESLNETTSVEDVKQLTEQLSMEFRRTLTSITRLDEFDSLEAKTGSSYELLSQSEVMLPSVSRTEILSAFAYALASLVNKDEADSIRELLNENSSVETIMSTLNGLLRKIELALDCKSLTFATSVQDTNEGHDAKCKTEDDYAVLFEFIDQLAIVCGQPPISSSRLDEVTLSTLLESLLTAIRQRRSIHVDASGYGTIKRLQDLLLGYFDDLAQTVSPLEQISPPTNIDLSTTERPNSLSDTLRDLSLDPEPWLTKFAKIHQSLSTLQLSDTRTRLMTKQVAEAFAEWTSYGHSYRYSDPSTTSEHLDMIKSGLSDLRGATVRITTRLLSLSDRLDALQAQLHPCSMKAIDSTSGDIKTETESHVIPALSDLDFSVSKLEAKWTQLEASVSEFSHNLQSDLTSVQEEMGLMEVETAMERLCHEEVSSRLTEMMTHLLPPGSPSSDSSSGQIYARTAQMLDHPVHTATPIPLRHFYCESGGLLKMPSESNPVYPLKSVQYEVSAADLEAPMHLESHSTPLHSVERRVLSPIKSFEEIAPVNTPRSRLTKHRCSRRSHSLPTIHPCIRDQTANSMFLSCLSRSTTCLQGGQLQEVSRAWLSQSFDTLSSADGTLRRVSLQRFVNVLETYFPAFLMQSSSQFHSSLEHLVQPSTLRAGLRYLRHLLFVLPDHSFHTEPSNLSGMLDTQIQIAELKLRQKLNQIRSQLACLQRKANLEKSNDQLVEQQNTRVLQLKQELSQVICAYKCVHDLLPVRLPLHPGGPTCRTFNDRSSDKLLATSIGFQPDTNNLSNRFDTLLRLLHLRDTEVLYLMNKLNPESTPIQVESLERKLVGFNESWCNVTPVNLSSMPVCRIPIHTFASVSGAIPLSTQLTIRLHTNDPKTGPCLKGDRSLLSAKPSNQGARAKEVDDWPGYESLPSSSTQKSAVMQSKTINYLIKQSELLLKRLTSGADSQAVTLIEDDLDHFVRSLADLVRQLKVTASAPADSTHSVTLAQNAPPLPTSPGYPRRSVRPSISDLIDAVDQMTDMNGLRNLAKHLFDQYHVVSSELELQLDTNWCLRQRLNAANLQLDQMSKLLHKGHHSYAYLEERLGVEADKHTALTDECDVARQRSRKTSQILDAFRARQEQRLTQLSPQANEEMRIESAPTLVDGTCAAPRIALKSIHSAGDVLKTGGTDSHTPAVVEYTRLITHSTIPQAPLKISVSSQTTKSSKLSCLSRSALNCAPHRKRSPSDTTPTRIYVRPHGIATSSARRRPTATTAGATLPSTLSTSSSHPAYFQSNNNSMDEVRVTGSSSVPAYPSDASVCDERQRLLSGWSDAATLHTDDTQLTESSILSLPSSTYSGTHSEPSRAKSPKRQKKRKRLFKLIGDRLLLTKQSSRPK
ncbi:hypothetical protein P879_08132 [Paragonimus westermani]|uniref:Uncharacterized protein n=1 Tax=Paragonimus westermani TaxID=34504 RepID=A0A8T0DLM8_9TREM|nr:hypothetical protein P879_08132 [Paragonimus westermani]